MKSKKRRLALAIRWLGHQLKRQKLKHLTIEVTKRCNAKCAFCPYWAEEQQEELRDFAAIVTQFNPLVVSLSGGEPLLRRDLIDLINKIRKADAVVYLSMVTNGALLTFQKAEELREAGLNQLSISLDYMGEKHDRERKIPGLYNHIKELLPELTPLGFDAITLNTVIKNDNLDHIPQILDFVEKTGISIVFSSYCSLKTGDNQWMVSEQNLKKLQQTIELIKAHKRENNMVRTSFYYLERVVEYFRKGEVPGCQAGIKWLQVTPQGNIKPCAELAEIGDYRNVNLKSRQPVSCSTCWYSCRGESEAPINLRRVKELW